MIFKAQGISRIGSLTAVLVVWAIVAGYATSHRPRQLFSWDSFGYHVYLSGAVIHQDPFMEDVSWVEQDRIDNDASGTLYQITTFSDGERITRYPIGLSILWSPWFLIGHGVAGVIGAPTDGFSTPYQLCVHIGVLIYLLIGLLTLRKVLLIKFSETVTSWTIALLFLGTNLLDQSITNVAMPHLPLFCLYTGILYLALRWVRDRRTKYAGMLAILLGLAALVRPSEILALLIPLLWFGSTEEPNILKRSWQLRRSWLLMAGIMFALGMIQFTYWKVAAGHWVVDSYNNPGEGFDLLRPHTWSFLFSYRKGWLLYTPMMVLSLVGLGMLRSIWREAFLPIVVFLLAYVYITSSWTCWWYADSFSSRPMVAIYAVLALPLAALLDRMKDMSAFQRWSLRVLIAALCLLNLFQHWQYFKGIIHSSRMTKAAYWAAFGKTEAPSNFGSLLMVHRSSSGDNEPPDFSRYARKSMDLEQYRTKHEAEPFPGSEPFGQTATLVKPDNPFSPEFRIPYTVLTNKDHAWIEVEWHVRVPSKATKLNCVTTFQHSGDNYGYNAFGVDDRDVEPARWDTLKSYYLTPEVRDPDDQLLMYYWLCDTVEVMVEGPHLIIYEPLW